MTKEQLAQANKLAEEIRTLTEAIEIWGKAWKVTGMTAMIAGTSTDSRVPVRCIDFEILKTLTISGLRKSLEEKQEQFNGI